VLVVEDNLDAADALTMLLQLMGFETQVAHDGLDAIELARSRRFGLIFVDIGLPGMDGYEVAKRLKGIEGRKSMLLVALTGYGRDEDKVRALGAGFDVHLVKPVEMETLEQLLARLEQPEATSEAV
jgi:CheY-like chemotaxis protein